MIAWLRTLAGRFEQRGLPLAAWPSEQAVTRINVVQIIVCCTLGSAILLRTGHFTYDQAYFYELSVRVAEHLRPAAYGPFVSGYAPVALTPGGLMYDVYAIPFLFARDPRFGVAWIQLLATAGFLLFDRFLRRAGAPASLRLAAVTLTLWSLRHARLTSTLWNADLFLFVAPALLYAAARWADGGRWRWAAAFGALSALALQTHLSGVLIVAAAVLATLLLTEKAIAPSSIAAALAVMTLCYAPFWIVEARDGFPDLHLLLGRAIPHRHALSGWTALYSLCAPVLAASHPQELWQLLPAKPDAIALAVAASAWLAVPAAVLGCGARFPLKATAAFAFVSLPVFFFATHRSYFEHYVCSATLLLALVPAAGVAVAMSRQGWSRRLGAGYLAGYAVVGLALLGAQSTREVAWAENPYAARTVPAQRALAERDVQALSAPRAKAEDETALVQPVLARRLLGRDLQFEVGGRLCRVDISLGGLDSPLPLGHEDAGVDAGVVVAGPNSVFLCP